MVSSLPLPPLLQALIQTGRWPTRDNVSLQNLHPLVSAALVRKLAPDETGDIHFLAPPFATIQERCDTPPYFLGGSRHAISNIDPAILEATPPIECRESDFWLHPDRAPGELRLDLALVIGDFGIGSDAPIILDYAEISDQPIVKRLRYSPEGNHWIRMAPCFHAFAEALGLA
jgi:hypothetical protein